MSQPDEQTLPPPLPWVDLAAAPRRRRLVLIRDGLWSPRHRRGGSWAIGGLLTVPGPPRRSPAPSHGPGRPRSCTWRAFRSSTMSPVPEIRSISRKPTCAHGVGLDSVPGLALRRVRYVDVGPVSMCATRAASDILPPETDRGRFWVTPR